MTTTEIYKLASELTEQESNNIILGWERDNDTKELTTVKTLIKLGDSIQIAVASTIAQKINYLGESEINRIAYDS